MKINLLPAVAYLHNDRILYKVIALGGGKSAVGRGETSVGAAARALANLGSKFNT